MEINKTKTIDEKTKVFEVMQVVERQVLETKLRMIFEKGEDGWTFKTPDSQIFNEKDLEQALNKLRELNKTS